MIRIVIVEDHTLFRKGIRSLLSDIEDFEIVSEFANGQEFIDQIFELDAHVVLMDIEMPAMNGIEAARLANIKKPDLQIIALSMYSDQSYYYDMIKSGISGFVLKEASTAELEMAIRNVYDGLGFFSPKLLKQAISHVPQVELKKRLIEDLHLTGREIEILNLICQGKTNKQISEDLFLSPRTVETHRTKLLRKTNSQNTAELIIYAIKNELIEI